jgi:hypothetical protein
MSTTVQNVEMQWAAQQAVYSGEVDEKGRPHGKGSLVFHPKGKTCSIESDNVRAALPLWLLVRSVFLFGVFFFFFFFFIFSLLLFFVL